MNQRREPVLHISDGQGNNLTLDRAGGNGVLLEVTGTFQVGFPSDLKSLGFPSDLKGPINHTLFWLKSDRVALLIDVLKKFL